MLRAASWVVPSFWLNRCQTRRRRRRSRAAGRAEGRPGTAGPGDPADRDREARPRACDGPAAGSVRQRLREARRSLACQGGDAVPIPLPSHGAAGAADAARGTLLAARRGDHGTGWSICSSFWSTGSTRGPTRASRARWSPTCARWRASRASCSAWPALRWSSPTRRCAAQSTQWSARGRCVTWSAKRWPTRRR